MITLAFGLEYPDTTGTIRVTMYKVTNGDREIIDSVDSSTYDFKTLRSHLLSAYLVGTKIYLQMGRPNGYYNFNKMLNNGLAQYHTMDQGRSYYINIDPTDTEHTILGAKA